MHSLKLDWLKNMNKTDDEFFMELFKFEIVIFVAGTTLQQLRVGTVISERMILMDTKLMNTVSHFELPWL